MSTENQNKHPSNVASATLAVAPGSALLVGYGPGFTDAEIQQSAFEMMANAHPHETFAAYPDRFVAYAQHINPALSREDIEQILRDTEHIES